MSDPIVCISAIVVCRFQREYPRPVISLGLLDNPSGSIRIAPGKFHKPRIEALEAPLAIGLSAFRLVGKPIRHNGLERRFDNGGVKRAPEFFREKVV